MARPAPRSPRSPPPPAAAAVLLSLALFLLPLLAAPRPAAAVKQTKAYVPPEEERNYTVHYWTGVGRKGFVWPEQDPSGAWHMPALTAKPSLGVALSGGGFRATTTGLGVARALHSRGLLSKARYLASNSGGSWLNGALSYTQMPWDVFFGPGPNPGDMEWEKVRKGEFVPAGSYGGAIEKGTIIGDALAGVVVDTVLTPDSVAQVKGWSDTVGEAFLDPFGVGPHGSCITALGAGAAGGGGGGGGGAKTTTTANNTTKTTTKTTATTGRRRRLLAAPATAKPSPSVSSVDALLGVAGPVAERVSAQAAAIPFLSAAAAPAKPFPLLVGSILAPNTTHPYRPVEFTPLYIATPGQDPAPVAGEIAATKQGLPASSYPPLGGVAVEPLGLNAYPPENTPSNPSNGVPKPSPNGQATAEARSRFVTPLVTMVGVSSSFVAQGLRPSSDAGEDITGTETLWYWGPSANKTTFEGREWGFADGGGVDNTAIIPLLRRGIRTIIAATSTAVTADANATNSTSWAVGQWDVAGLFGAVPLREPAIKQGKVNGMLVQDFNGFMQVFPRAGYEKMYRAIEAAVAAGKPSTYRLKTEVLPNKWQGVQGGYDVDLLWFFNQPCAEFEAALPNSTRDALAGARRDDKTNKQQQKAAIEPDLKTFPMISTFNADYSPALTTLLAGQSEWQANEAGAEMDEMVAAAEAEAAAAAGGAAAAAAAAGTEAAAAPAPGASPAPKAPAKAPAPAAAATTATKAPAAAAPGP